LNNVVEQDHRFLNRCVNPGVGFGAFATAQRTIQGYEAMHMLHKGQLDGLAKWDVLTPNRVINQLFEVAAWQELASRSSPSTQFLQHNLPVTYAWPKLLFCLLEKNVPRTAEEAEAGTVAALEHIEWIAVMVGIFERALITTLMAYDVSGGARLSQHGSPSRWRLDGRGGAREHGMPGPQPSWRCWGTRCPYSLG
jgi:hypothetical protein